jgi:hypothetical protein
MKNLILILLLFYFNLTAMASNYYLSEKGNDSNSGKSKDAPWCTIDKLSEQMRLMKPGDSVLIDRGSVFQGVLKIVTSGIYVGAYGIGAKPVFTGSIAITQWKYSGNNIWVGSCADCNTEPGNLFINGVPQVLGRYPNTELLTIAGTGQHDISLTDTTLSFSDAYWNTAEVVVRSSRWTFDNLTIKQHSSNTFTFNSPASYPLLNGFGYFIQRHISTLDQHGEWYFNPSEKKIYLYLNTGKKPGQQIIEVSVRDTGLNLTDVKNIVVQNLTFKNYTQASVNLLNTSSVILKGVDVAFSGKNGMEISFNRNVNINNCSVIDSNNNGVTWHNTTQSQFTQNQICRTGLHPGRGESGNGTYIALYITSDLPMQEQNLFQSNTIDSVGYSAIDFRTGNTKIKNNLISNFCLVKDDGAGIYTWNNIRQGNTIEGNRISHGVGTGVGTLSPSQQFAHGIYIDDRSKYVAIRDNTISHCAGSGIFLHNAKNISVIKNLTYLNGRNISNQEKGELYIRLDTLGQFGKHRDTQLNIEGNTWIADETTHNIFISVERKNELLRLGLFSNNHFEGKTGHMAIAVLVRQNGSCMAEQVTLEEWQQMTAYERKSVFKFTTVPQFKTVGNDIILNGTMTKNIKGWTVWPEKTTITQETIEILDGPSLSINIPVGNTEALLYQEGVSFSKGKMYRLSFTAISPELSHVEFVPLMASEPWQALSAYTCFTIGATRKTFTYYFVADKSNNKARVNFKSHSNFWIDTISLYEVEVNGE